MPTDDKKEWIEKSAVDYNDKDNPLNLLKHPRTRQDDSIRWR